MNRRQESKRARPEPGRDARRVQGRQIARPCRRASRFCWCAGHRGLCIEAHAPIITARSPKGWWLGTPSAVPGITPASICGQARRLARPPSARSRAGRSSSDEDKIFVRAQARGAETAPAGLPDSARERSSSSAAARPVSPRPRAPARAIPGQHRHAQQRQRAARRSAQSLQGLPRRQGAGGLDAAAGRELLSKNGIDLRLKTNVTGIDVRGREGHAGRRRAGRLRPAAARDRRRAGAADDPGRRPAACPYPALARRLPGDHRQRRDGAQARRAWVRASSASKSRPRCAPVTSRSTWWRRTSGRWSGYSARRWATSCARCTRSTAWSSTSRTRRPPSTASG